MGTYTTRLGCQLSFDDEQESDIVDVIQQLSSSRKLGHFVSHLVRLSIDSPELIYKRNGKFEQGYVIDNMEKCGMSLERKKFMDEIRSEISQMKQKIDSIYELAMETYTLGLMNKYLGIEAKSDNELLATFVLERQLKKIQDTLGLDIRDPVYASNKLNDSHTKAEDTMEYLVNTYGSMIDAIKSSLQPQIVYAAEKVATDMPKGVADIPKPAEASGAIGEAKAENVGVNTNLSGASTSSSLDEAIDFGDTSVSGDASGSSDTFGGDDSFEGGDNQFLMNFFNL